MKPKYEELEIKLAATEAKLAEMHRLIKMGSLMRRPTAEIARYLFN